MKKETFLDRRIFRTKRADEFGPKPAPDFLSFELPLYQLHRRESADFIPTFKFNPHQRDYEPKFTNYLDQLTWVRNRAGERVFSRPHALPASKNTELVFYTGSVSASIHGRAQFRTDFKEYTPRPGEISGNVRFEADPETFLLIIRERNQAIEKNTGDGVVDSIFFPTQWQTEKAVSPQISYDSSIADYQAESNGKRGFNNYEPYDAYLIGTPREGITVQHLAENGQLYDHVQVPGGENIEYLAISPAAQTLEGTLHLVKASSNPDGSEKWVKIYVNPNTHQLEIHAMDEDEVFSYRACVTKFINPSSHYDFESFQVEMSRLLTQSIGPVSNVVEYVNRAVSQKNRYELQRHR